MSAETLLDVFDPPDGLVGHSAALVAMTGTEDFLEQAMLRFSGLRPRQRAELGQVFAYLMLAGHESSSRKAVFPPGRIPGLHELQPRAVHRQALLHAKVALLAFAPNRMGAPVHLRLAVFTANFTYASARQQLELVWMLDVPLEGSTPAVDRADIAAAGAFVSKLAARWFHREEQGLPAKQRKLTARFDALLSVAASIAPTNRKPRFVHSLEEPLYPQICARFRSVLDKSRNFLLCGSGFYEESDGGARKPTVLGKLEDLGVFTSQARRVVLVEPKEAGAIATWAREGQTEGWEVVRPYDALAHNRRLHAKFVYAGYLRDGHLSNGCLYLGSGNLSRRGLLSHGGMVDGNVEAGVVVSVDERFGPEDCARRLFWSEEVEPIADDEWESEAGDGGPESQTLLEVPPILSATVDASSPRRLRLFWCEDAASDCKVSLSWTGRDWFDIQRGEEVTLEPSVPT